MEDEMDIYSNKGNVAIVSATESFLAKSIRSKLEDTGIPASFVHADVTEFKDKLEGTLLVILFMNDELLAMPEALVYLKDIIRDKEMGLILIGQDQEYEVVKKTIPEHAVSEWFNRPVDIDALIKTVSTYLDENTGDKRKKSVLIVDDDITYMRTVYEWLKGSYHIGMASSGIQAISYLARNRADLILLDYEMPIADGPQVMSMLKSDSEMESIPVMFLTGHGDRDSVLSVVGLSPVDYLLKTIDKETLLKKIDDFFASSK